MLLSIEKNYRYLVHIVMIVPVLSQSYRIVIVVCFLNL